MDAPVPIFQQTLGPLGLDVVPAGDYAFEEVVEAYRARLLAKEGPVHINGMITMAECRAAILAVRERGCDPVWVSWTCGEEGESVARVHMLAALFVAEGMGAAAFGLNCRRPMAEELLAELAHYASVPLFSVWDGQVETYAYESGEHDPDVIPCATSTAPCFVTRTVDVGEEIECTPDLLEDIIAAEDAGMNCRSPQCAHLCPAPICHPGGAVFVVRCAGAAGVISAGLSGSGFLRWNGRPGIG